VTSSAPRGRWRALPGLRAIGEAERRAVEAALLHGALYRGGGLNPATEAVRAEQELSALTDRRHALVLNSATSALVAALVAVGVGPGDEVILPGYGWLTDVSAVLSLGAVPVFAPIGQGLGLDPARLREAFGPRTRAVLPIHPLGQACDIGAIVEVAREQGVAVVEDACQLLRRPLHAPGPRAHITVLSFQAFKLVTSGEGGCLLADDEALYVAATRYHDAGLARFAHGLVGTYSDRPVGIGLNLRMSELTAALLRPQLARTEALLASQRTAAAQLLEAAAPLLDTGVAERVTPCADRDSNGTFLVLRAATAEQAVHVVEHFRSAGIGWTYAPLDTTHTLPGWLAWLRDQRLEHRVVDEASCRDELARTLYLEIDATLSGDDLALFRNAAEAAARA
jgi:dTDP-4-amino-4,6-dideoxygalactose transaminase